MAFRRIPCAPKQGIPAVTGNFLQDNKEFEARQLETTIHVAHPERFPNTGLNSWSRPSRQRDSACGGRKIERSPQLEFSAARSAPDRHVAIHARPFRLPSRRRKGSIGIGPKGAGRDLAFGFGRGTLPLRRELTGG
jgi:hypothetical protein